MAKVDSIKVSFEGPRSLFDIVRESVGPDASEDLVAGIVLGICAVAQDDLIVQKMIPSTRWSFVSVIHNGFAMRLRIWINRQRLRCEHHHSCQRDAGGFSRRHGAVGGWRVCRL